MSVNIESKYRTRTDGWHVWQHALLLAFYLVAAVGIISFAAFDALILAKGSENWPGDGRNWVIVLFIGFSISLQAGWGFAVWKIYRMPKPLRAIFIALVPLTLLSIPFGILAYSEFFGEPPPAAPRVY